MEEEEEEEEKEDEEEDEEEYEVEAILKERCVYDERRDEFEMLYKVQWAGYAEATWEPEANVKGTEALATWKVQRVEVLKEKKAKRKAEAKRQIEAAEAAEAAAKAEAEAEAAARAEAAEAAKAAAAALAEAAEEDEDIFVDVAGAPKVPAGEDVSAPAGEQADGEEATAEGNEAEGEEEDDEGEGEEFEVEAILDYRAADDGSEEYLVKWVGFTEEENTWEPRESVDGLDVLEAFERKMAKKATKFVVR